ncbi:YceI family protein [Yinghuangia aomiensis]|uniref:YceI family protein n=1 Tax=Yinghuangia aomiensis TaxID=676205 RepID=A0ABP9HUS4_9ACTN
MTDAITRDELTGDYALDTASSRIGFVARHTVGPKVRGYFEEFAGGVSLDGGDPSASAVSLAIRARSVRTHNGLRDKLVRGKFLDQSAHPDISFRSTSTRQIGARDFELAGDLTIRGVTGRVTLALNQVDIEPDEQGDIRIRFTGQAVINRKNWRVQWIAAAGMVARDVAVEFDVVVVRRA